MNYPSPQKGLGGQRLEVAPRIPVVFVLKTDESHLEEGVTPANSQLLFFMTDFRHRAHKVAVDDSPEAVTLLDLGTIDLAEHYPTLLVLQPRAIGENKKVA